MKRRTLAGHSATHPKIRFARTLGAPSTSQVRSLTRNRSVA